MFADDNTLLFYEYDLGGTLRSMVSSVAQKVDGVPKDQFLNASEDALVEHLLPSLLVDPLELHEDSMVMEQEEQRVDVSHDPDRVWHRDRGDGPVFVPGVAIKVSIPATGDFQLWRMKPSQWQSIFPRGNPRSPGASGIGSLEILIKQPSDAQPEKIKGLLDQQLKSLRFYLQSQKSEIEGHNSSIERHLRQAIQNRRERIFKHDGIADVLGIPLKENQDAPEIRPLDVKRRLVRPLPPAPSEGFKPEPGIRAEDYEHILGVIRHEGRTFESTPATYAVHDEEELRDIVLAHLNGHYQGDATGETFRKKGKTDIRIEDDNRSAFVAECKVWRGQKELLEAIDQLLGYLIWRDCKAALVIFNKHNARFSELLEKVPEVLSKHDNIVKEPEQVNDGEWRLVLASAEDEARHISMHVFLFNLYSL